MRTNIQVNGNVYGGIHVNGRGASVGVMPDDCAPARHDYGPGVVFALGRVFAALWALTKGITWLVLGVLQLGAWVTFTTLAFGVWALGRAANLVLIAERSMGGAPAQLVYVPSVLRPNYDATPMLGAGHTVNELAQLESEYDHAN